MSTDTNTDSTRPTATDETTEPDTVVDDPVLEIRDANVTYSDGDTYVLEDVTVDIDRHEVLGIVGESGSGKSMFASALMDAVPDPGLLTGGIRYHPPDGETVDVLELSDEELRKFRWEQISMVFQGAMSSFNPTMEIGTHFTETLKSHDKHVSEGMEFARELLENLYLEPERVLNSYPHELSGGMQQRALIALSMVLDPEVLVMDEPTAALDLLMQRSILGLLEELRDEYDLTIIFITHDLPLVASLADRMAIIYAFQFAEIGERDAIIGDSAHPYTRALLNATPNLDAPLEEMQPIEGEGPAPVNVPSGCRYHPRCPLATEECRTVDPPFAPIDEASDHRTACHHWEEAREEIPLNFGEDAPDAASVDSPRPAAGSTVEDRAVAAGDQALLSLDDIEVHFEEQQGLLDRFRGDPDVVQAVDGIDLDIHEQDLVCLLGESGCGKTTLGKTMIGLQRPTGGTIEYRGHDIWEAKDGNADIPYDEVRQALQIIHQDPGSSLNPNRRIVDILSEPLHHTHPNIGRAERRSRMHSLLERVGMTPAGDFLDRYPHQLSGGEKQRVALARALLMNPDAILADEAISAVDVSLRIEIMDLMLELQSEFHTSFLFISHDLSNARYFAEHGDGRIAVMYLGEIVEIGSAERLIHDPRHPYTEVLRWATPNLDLDAMEADDPPIRDIDVPDPVDPPSGCRFHTRCPVAREACTRDDPELLDVDGGDGKAACFREDPDHEYWESEPLEGAVEHPEEFAER
ncbi:ABC transporter ATP-binding protein [Candidatus Halobonum tyrrellensis]|uniref:Peptide ABC transporter ATPase n=1 Tax=Candidatus Halobonum tyrrellensis G22 TaxID=1324957 RepID=V4HGZ6_9EURY|nr:ABC transporter ATP-binding protein [Candidatus Halobonum tyrrellensis]ESP87114.1 peptide ABC transporter ATPase [Candidatus Halobonum tyrrellensis G22]